MCLLWFSVCMSSDTTIMSIFFQMNNLWTLYRGSCAFAVLYRDNYASAIRLGNVKLRARLIQLWKRIGFNVLSLIKFWPLAFLTSQNIFSTRMATPTYAITTKHIFTIFPCPQTAHSERRKERNGMNGTSSEFINYLTTTMPGWIDFLFQATLHSNATFRLSP